MVAAFVLTKEIITIIIIRVLINKVGESVSTKLSLPVMSRLGVIFLTWRRYLENGIRPYGITLKQQYLLRQLSAEGFLYPSDIADKLF